MTNLPLLTLLLSLLLLPVTLADKVFTLSNPSCSSPWSISEFEYECGGDSECSFGDGATASGLVYVGSTFDADEEYTITFAVTVFGITITEVEEPLCNCITPEDGQDCGAVGTYSFETNVQIPDENTFASILANTVQSVTVKVTISDVTSCTATVSYVQSSSYSMMWAASVAVLGTSLVATALFLRSRRRRVEEESLKHTLTDFEMPPEPSTRRCVQV